MEFTLEDQLKIMPRKYWLDVEIDGGRMSVYRDPSGLYYIYFKDGWGGGNAMKLNDVVNEIRLLRKNKDYNESLHKLL